MQQTKHQAFTDESIYPYVLPSLDYAYNALEPHIDSTTMQIHHTKHHQAYIDKLNEALVKHPEIAKVPLAKLLQDLKAIPEDIKETFKNNSGGHYNHSFFWKILTPNSTGKPEGELNDAIEKTFENFEKFKSKFNEAAKTKFGSGWAWLSMKPDGSLIVYSTSNQDCPISENMMPIIGLDVWEHAYYLKYQNKRPDYINAWWAVVNWEQAEKNYKEAKEKFNIK